MVTVDRWKAAQEYEHGYWEDVAANIVSGTAPNLDWYRWRADVLAERLRKAGLQRLADGNACMVEIGGGPVGLATFFRGTERIAVDPLQTQYGKNPVLSRMRDPAVRYLEGVGESLPCDSGNADIVAIENCIDHVRDVDAVMNEIVRVLRPDGVLYLTVNCRTRWGYVMHRLLSRLQIDRGHPHTFTPRKAIRLVESYGFKPLMVQVESALRAHVDDLRAPGLRTKAKGLLGVSEYLITILAQRQPA